jgi:HEAT repeat protein
MPEPKARRRQVAIGLATAASVVVAAAAIRSYSAYVRAEAVRATALERHGGDPVEALMAFLEDDGPPLGDKNLAVWQLGRLGDPRAIPALERQQTGRPCDHARFVCQREIEKALAKLTRDRSAVR